MYSEAESSLIALCLKGDRQAQYTLYKRYSDAMFNVCHRMLGNEAEAEDVLQESFIDVFRRLDSFRAESSLGHGSNELSSTIVSMSSKSDESSLKKFQKVRVTSRQKKMKTMRRLSSK